MRYSKAEGSSPSTSKPWGEPLRPFAADCDCSAQASPHPHPGSPQVVACDLLDKLDDASPYPSILHPHERLREREPVGGSEELRHIIVPRRLYKCLGVRRQVWCALEEKWHRDLQDVRDVLQAARADAVLSALIFLHLLEREPEAVAEFLLTHSEHHPTHPDTAAYVLVDGVWDLFDHCLFHD